MGYTHYHYQKPKLDVKKWKEYTEGVNKILALDVHGLLAFESNQTDKKPLVDSEIVRFNGKNENGHETFWFSRVTEIASYLSDKSMAFGFCKTARKDYDGFVVACLLWAKIIFGNDVRFSSDGDIGDFQEGKGLVEKALGIEIEIGEGGGEDCGFSVKVKEKV